MHSLQCLLYGPSEAQRAGDGRDVHIVVACALQCIRPKSRSRPKSPWSTLISSIAESWISSVGKEASLDDDPITRHSDLGCPDRHHNSKEYGYSHASDDCGPPRPRSLRIHVAGQELESGPAFHRQTVIKPVETRLCDEWFLLPTKCLFDVAHGLANYERTAR